MCMVANAIANQGTMLEPKLIYRALNDYQAEYPIIRTALKPTVYKKPLTPANAQVIKNAMNQVVKSGSGRSAAVPSITIDGKTGSAQTVLEGESVTHAWFVGFIDSQELPYSISIIVEKGGSGSRVAAPLAKTIFNYIKKHYTH